MKKTELISYIKEGEIKNFLLGMNEFEGSSKPFEISLIYDENKGYTVDIEVTPYSYEVKSSTHRTYSGTFISVKEYQKIFYEDHDEYNNPYENYYVESREHGFDYINPEMMSINHFLDFEKASEVFKLLSLLGHRTYIFHDKGTPCCFIREGAVECINPDNETIPYDSSIDNLECETLNKEFPNLRIRKCLAEIESEFRMINGDSDYKSSANQIINDAKNILKLSKMNIDIKIKMDSLLDDVLNQFNLNDEGDFNFNILEMKIKECISLITKIITNDIKKGIGLEINKLRSCEYLYIPYDNEMYIGFTEPKQMKMYLDNYDEKYRVRYIELDNKEKIEPNEDITGNYLEIFEKLFDKYYDKYKNEIKE